MCDGASECACAVKGVRRASIFRGRRGGKTFFFPSSLGFCLDLAGVSLWCRLDFAWISLGFPLDFPFPFPFPFSFSLSLLLLSFLFYFPSFTFYFYFAGFIPVSEGVVDAGC